MVDFQTLENTENIDQFLLPLSNALPRLPQLNLSEENALRLQQGKIVTLEKAFNNGLIKVFQNQAFLGLGEIENCILKVKRLFCRPC